MKPTAEDVRKLIRYEPETGEFFWIPQSRRPHQGKGGYVRRGKIQNKPSLHGYIKLGICGRNYQASHVAWLYMTGEWPARLIDHKNRQPSDNRWCNLRQATSTQNNANKKTNINSACGLKGVRQKGKRFEARITDLNGGIRRLGMFDTATQAHAAYITEARKLFGEFARSR